MKLLLLVSVLSFSSCAILEGAKNLVTGSYEAGKVRGRMEILHDLSENKKKLEMMEALMLQEVLTVIDTKDYDKFKRETAKITAMLAPILIEKSQLKKELEASKKQEMEANQEKEDAPESTT